MALLFFYLFLALFVSFLCSVMESVLLSTPLSFLYAKEEAGQKAASKFIKLKSDIDRPLAAILSLNTVAHTIGAAGVGSPGYPCVRGGLFWSRFGCAYPVDFDIF